MTPHPPPQAVTPHPAGPFTPHPHSYITREARREPALYVLASFLYPGLGQLIAGDIRRGLGFAAVWVVVPVGAFFVLYFTLFTTRVNLLTFNAVLVMGALAIMFGSWIYGMVDAYRAARQHNRENGWA